MRFVDLLFILALSPIAALDTGVAEPAKPVIEAAPASAREHNFVLVTAMPQVRGPMVESSTGHDPATGLAWHHAVHQLDGHGFVLKTHVVRLDCGATRAHPAHLPLIMALQILPHRASNRNQALRRDRFAQVYVRDPRGVRLHENLDRRAMADLTRKAYPACQMI